jgi:hypothetical protein
VAAVGLVAGCEVGSIRRSPPPRSPPRPAAAMPARPGIAEERQVRVRIPLDFTVQSLTFVDSTRGYALYTRCDDGPAAEPNCEASLIATVDGGRSWLVRRHPHPFATNQQMVVGGNGAVMLLAEPYGWYLSRDGGLTFRHTGDAEHPPDDYYTLPGRFQLWYSSTEPVRVVEYVGGRSRGVPAQPPLPVVTDTKYDESGRLWAAGVAAGRPVVALSRDAGRTWQRQQVPGSGDPVERVSLQISAGASDVWLTAQSAQDAFPQLWLYDGERWQDRSVANHPAYISSVAALGSGALAMTLPGGAGLVQGEAYWGTDWPLDGGALRVLSDETLLASKGPYGEVFLGLGHGIFRQWVHVLVLQT